MADQKISQLSDGGASQAADEYVVARSGANYRIDGASVAAAATSVGTLTSLTVSGDLTVDTSTLKVDAANNRVGVGLTNPGETLDVKGTGNFNNVGGTYLGFQHNGTQVGYVGTANAIITGGATTNFGLYAQSAMVFSSGGATERMRLDASGNLGLGVTPSAWSVLTPAMQMGTAGSFIASQGSTAAIYIGTNAFFDGTNFKYVINDAASRYLQNAGAHSWFNAASGTAGNTITFTQAMTLDASGRLGIGSTSPGQRLVVQDTSSAPYVSLIAGASSAMGILMGTSGNTVDGQIVYSNSTQAMTFVTASTERARIDSSGNLGVGTTSPSTRLQLDGGKFSITGATVASGFANSTIRILGSQTMADDATVTVSVANATILYVSDNNVGQGVLFYLDYNSGTVVKLADPNDIGAVSDTDGKLCAYKNATTNSATVKNRLGSSKSITVGMISVSD